MRGHRAALALLLPAILASAGCSDNEPPLVCIDAGVDPASCTPAYEPTYDAVYANTFHPSCAKSGVSCHASTGRQGGVTFDDPNEAYRDLADRKLVRGGQPACSVLVHRVVATDGKTRMPPGASLPQGDQCAIVRWIANGAKR